MLYSSTIRGNKKRKKQLALKNPNKQNKTNEQKTKQTNKETKTKNGDQWTRGCKAVKIEHGIHKKLHKDQGPVVQKADSVIHWINHYPAGKC